MRGRSGRCAWDDARRRSVSEGGTGGVGSGGQLGFMVGVDVACAAAAGGEVVRVRGGEGGVWFEDVESWHLGCVGLWWEELGDFGRRLGVGCIRLRCVMCCRE